MISELMVGGVWGWLLEVTLDAVYICLCMSDIKERIAASPAAAI